MVTRIRQGSGSRRRIYLREWRKYLEASNPALTASAMAERLDIERESYYRLERKPWMLNGREIIEIEEAMGIEPGSLLRPPPRPDAPPSLDAIAQGASREQLDMIADVVRRVLGRAS